MSEPIDLKMFTFSMNTIRLVPNIVSDDRNLQQLRSQMVLELDRESASALVQAKRADTESARKRRSVSSLCGTTMRGGMPGP